MRGAGSALLLAATLLPATSDAQGLNERIGRLEGEVRAAEEAFAKTMADRDHDAFVSFLAEDAVFLGRTVLRGRTAVAEGWKAYYEGETAPFSWRPERVAVLASGDLAVSTGPVFDPAGKRVGTFVSTWRHGEDGWRIVLDTGCPPCADP